MEITDMLYILPTIVLQVEAYLCYETIINKTILSFSAVCRRETWRRGQLNVYAQANWLFLVFCTTQCWARYTSALSYVSMFLYHILNHACSKHWVAWCWLANWHWCFAVRTEHLSAHLTPTFHAGTCISKEPSWYLVE